MADRVQASVHARLYILVETGAEHGVSDAELRNGAPDGFDQPGNVCASDGSLGTAPAIQAAQEGKVPQAKSIKAPKKKAVEVTAAIESTLTQDERAYDPYLRGREYLRRSHSFENLTLAQTAFDEAIAADPAFAQAHAGLCEAFLGQYQLHRENLPFVLAQKACAQALTLDPELVEVNLSLGALYRVSGDYAQALENLDTARVAAPDNAEVYTQLGHTLDRLGRGADAEDAYIQAVALEPGFWGVYVDLANYYYTHAEYAKALELFERTLVMAGTERATVQHSIATVQLATGAFQKALQTYETVLRETGTPRRSTLTNLGMVNYYLGCYEDAARWQQRALQLAPRDHRLIGRLAESCRFLPDGERHARTLWATAIAAQSREQNQADWESQGLIAIYHAHRGEMDAARGALQVMWALEPEPSTAHYFEAIVTTKAGGDATAARMLALDHGFPPALIDNDPDLHPPPACPLPREPLAAAAACILDK